MNVGVKKQRQSPVARRDPLADIAKELVLRMPDLAPGSTKAIAQALRELFSGNDELSRTRRLAMQHYLAETAEQQDTTAQVTESMLSIDAAAELMQCNRPYVAMLMDHRLLAGAWVTEDGQRRVPESSVRAWIAERKAKAGEADYRAAAAETGMYDVPEELFIERKSRRRP